MAPQLAKALGDPGAGLQPLDVPDIWIYIHQLVGSGYYLQLASVCRAWRTRCARSRQPKVTSMREATASVGALQWALANGFPTTPYARSQMIAWAARCGSVEVLRWLRAAGHPWGAFACSAAAAAGRLAALQWLRARGCPWDAFTCGAAAEGGHLDCLRWAHAHGAACDRWTCAAAAQGGQLRVLEWLRASGCPWDEWACRFAAERGHVAVLAWLRARGCPWGEATCLSAVLHRRLDALRWLRAHGCPWDRECCARFAEEGAVRAWVLAHA